jgi:hypothetical protein
MKFAWLPLLIAVPATYVHAQESPSLAAEHLDLLSSHCHFALPETLRKSVLSSSRKDYASGYVQFSFLIAFTEKAPQLRGQVSFNCIDQTKVAPLTITSPNITSEKVKNLRPKKPSVIIREEDAGGRYFRHLAWERKLRAANWVANVAFSDYTFGDGQRSGSSFYLVCHADVIDRCFEIASEDGTSHSRSETLQVLKFLSKILSTEP